MAHILQEDATRFVLFPVRYPKLFERYEQHLSCFWNTKECDLSQDRTGFDTLTTVEQDFLLDVLGFFAASDGIIIENIMCNFQTEVMVPEARAFYSIQNAIENIHSQQYSLLIETFAPDEARRTELFQAVERHKTTKAKADWAIGHMQRDTSIDKVTDFSKRLIAFACVEGIMFSSSFAAIFFFKNRGIQMPGLFLSNEFIARDEGLHRDFAVDLYQEFPRLPAQEVAEIVRSAVKVEQDFVKEILPTKLAGMNSTLMCAYVEYVADHLMVALGYEKVYETKMPALFGFMTMLSLEGKTNFFERRVSEYGLAGVGESNNTFSLDSSF